MIGVLTRKPSFSAIARSVMISAKNDQPSQALNKRFSAIARSVMISALSARFESHVVTSVSVL